MNLLRFLPKREGSLVETGSGQVPAYLPAGSHIPGLLLRAEAAPGAALRTPYHPQHFLRAVQTDTEAPSRPVLDRIHINVSPDHVPPPRLVTEF